MAIDRDTAYYKEWRNDRDWKLRFEIIPAGKFVDSSHNYSTLSWVAMKRGAISIKGHKTSFDKIPAGVMDAPSITVEFELPDLHPNLVEILKKPFYNHSAEALDIDTTNLFILKSDRGTGTISYIEFMGGQKNTLSNSYRMDADGTARTVTIDAIDVLKLVLEQTATSDWATNIITRGIAVETNFVPNQLSQFLVDYTVTDGSGNTITKYDRAYNQRVYGYRPSYMFTYGLISGIRLNLAAWTRSGNPTTYNIDLNRHPFYPIGFYEGTTTSANSKGSLLSDSDVWAVGKVTGAADETDLLGGMLVADKDGESYLAYDYLWDLLKNVVEFGCSKMTYKPKLVANTTGAVMDLSYEISFDRIFANPSATVQDLSDRFADAHGEKAFEFIPSSGVYTSVTSEIPNESGDDLDHFEARILGTKSDERINIQMIHHNNPTVDGVELDPFGSGIAAELRAHARKLYTSNSLKIHESVKIHDGITETSYDNPLAITYTGDIKGISGYGVASQSQNGIHIAVADFYLSRFSNASQNKITCTMFLADGETMPENTGDLVTIPTFTNFDSSDKATILEMETDWNKGTTDITFISRGV